LNRMPVKVLTATSGSMASTKTPLPADPEAFTRDISPSRTRFVNPIRQPSPLAFFIDGDISMTTQTQYDLAPANQPEFELTVTPVPDEQRIDFWPQHFGSIPQWLTLEPHIFAWMDRFCTTYGGGIWSFHTLSNSGAFMAPEYDSDDKWHLFNCLNGNDADMSAEAAGIAVCLIEYSHHACRTECDAMTAHFYRLRDYALQHPEAHAILRIID